MATVLTQANYGAETLIGAPQSTAPGQTTCTSTALLSQTDANDSAKSATIAIAISQTVNGQTTWARIASATWKGGENAPDNTMPPNISASLPTPLPAQVRTELDWNAPGSVGLDQVLS